MLKQKLIEGNDSRNQGVCNALLTYEVVDGFDSEYLVLHRVQLMPTADSELLIDCPLDDDEVLVHFENMLSSAVCNLPVMQSEVTA